MTVLLRHIQLRHSAKDSNPISEHVQLKRSMTNHFDALALAMLAENAAALIDFDQDQ